MQGLPLGRHGHGERGLLGGVDGVLADLHGCHIGQILAQGKLSGAGLGVAAHP